MWHRDSVGVTLLHYVFQTPPVRRAVRPVTPTAGSETRVNEKTTAITLALLFRSVGAVLFGVFSDRFWRKWPLVFNLLLVAVLELGAGFANTSRHFFVLRSLFGISMGGVWGLTSSTALENLPVGLRDSPTFACLWQVCYIWLQRVGAPRERDISTWKRRRNRDTEFVEYDIPRMSLGPIHPIDTPEDCKPQPKLSAVRPIVQNSLGPRQNDDFHSQFNGWERCENAGKCVRKVVSDASREVHLHLHYAQLGKTGQA
ncbi:hypothetical protein C8J57DRAFT_1458980 [Mycena rebaudengoi]|nr:hypothetical protein C8J57DRAFT_1458980 [Mycena rebaudengoi]